MKNKPIGIFDSGLGGLTAVKEINKLMPTEDIIYFGDTGRIPYGNRSYETIIKYARQDIAFLKAMDVKIISAACGTVSSALIKTNSEENVIGVIEPTCIAAANLTKNKIIGVIGTSATINSNAYKYQLSKIDNNIIVHQQSCPLLVPLIENGFIAKSDEILCKTVQMYIEPFIELNVGTLILGCTHYPIIESVISNLLPDIKIINSGKETAKFIYKKLTEQNLRNTKNTPGTIKFFVSDSTENFSDSATKFLGYDICKNVQKIDINAY